MTDQKDTPVTQTQPEVQTSFILPAAPPVQPQLNVFQQNVFANLPPSPYPTAAEFTALAAIDPTLPDRIMKQAELTLEHNRKLLDEQQAQSRMVIESQNRTNEINAKAQSDNLGRQKMMDVLGFIFLMSVVVASVVIGIITQSDAMLKVFLGGLAALVLYVWVKGRHPSK